MLIFLKLAESPKSLKILSSGMIHATRSRAASDRAGRRWNRSAPRLADRQDGTRRAASGRSGSPVANTRLATSCPARLGRPGGDRLLGEPHRQAPALAQAGVVGRPIGDLMPLPRDMMAAVLVQLERQEEHPG